MDIFIKSLSAFSNVFTIVASGIAIYLFITKRGAISSAFRVFLNFSSQLTLSELNIKLERLNDLSANDNTQMDDIINIFNEIAGQIRGNKALCKQWSDLLTKIDTIAKSKRRLTEPRKRAIVSELRERLRNVDVKNYADLIGESK